MILQKSVEYISYALYGTVVQDALLSAPSPCPAHAKFLLRRSLQQLVTAQAVRRRKLEERLKGFRPSGAMVTGAGAPVTDEINEECTRAPDTPATSL